MSEKLRAEKGIKKVFVQGQEENLLLELESVSHYMLPCLVLFLAKCPSFKIFSNIHIL